MTRNYLFLFIAAAFLFSCKSNKPTEEVTDIEISKFEEMAAELVGQEVSISGMAIHVCAHWGDKLHLTNDDNSSKITVYSDEELSSFPSDLEGKKVRVYGIVMEQIITEEMLSEWEAGHKAEHEAEHAEEKEKKAKADTKKDKEVVTVDGSSDDIVVVSAKDVVVEVSGKNEGSVEISLEGSGQPKTEQKATKDEVEEKEEEVAHDCGHERLVNLRKKMNESKDGTIRRYWVEVSRYEVIE